MVNNVFCTTRIFYLILFQIFVSEVKSAPDLYPASGSATPTTSGPNGSINLNFSVGNQGDATSNEGVAHFYWNQNTPAYNTPIGSVDIRDLAPAEQAQRIFTFIIPSGTSPGTYFLSLEVDATNTTPEGLNENNNRQAFQLSLIHI